MCTRVTATGLINHGQAAWAHIYALDVSTGLPPLQRSSKSQGEEELYLHHNLALHCLHWAVFIDVADSFPERGMRQFCSRPKILLLSSTPEPAVAVILERRTLQLSGNG